MKRSFCLYLFIFISGLVHSQTVSVRTLEIDSVAGNNKIAFEHFQGKKILLINAELLDTSFFQWKELRQLQNMHSNNLVVVILPPANMDKQTVAGFFQSANFSFVVASNVSTESSGLNQLYNWLEKKSLNGFQDTNPREGLQKYLINENGNLIGVYNRRVRPLSDLITGAL